MYSKSTTRGESRYIKVAWRRHKYLTNAAKLLNSKYTLQLLIWLSILSLNSILQIYELLKGHLEIYSNSREMFLAILFLILLTAITVVCHITAYEANKLGRILTSPEYFDKDNSQKLQMIFSIGQYFLFNPFNFSACGLFNVNLPLLMAIASGITTYLVILM
ncbi:gustatory receptor for sugar taste 43a-like [Leptopilina heterotoma]|uniref:gustatory receptor for sugar taste 43a-like n=1 Tax=Leptopilina heterotoma TaxID=63436 RepID=UPI001CA877D6|nr:gustatory receptor for sugar taste 43a-like [Leptopilina heterotoma]